MEVGASMNIWDKELPKANTRVKCPHCNKVFDLKEEYEKARKRVMEMELP